jgi:hypothetical protein
MSWLALPHYYVIVVNVGQAIDATALREQPHANLEFLVAHDAPSLASRKKAKYQGNKQVFNIY